jgi:hypothetical protein
VCVGSGRRQGGRLRQRADAAQGLDPHRAGDPAAAGLAQGLDPDGNQRHAQRLGGGADRPVLRPVGGGGKRREARGREVRLPQGGGHQGQDLVRPGGVAKADAGDDRAQRPGVGRAGRTAQRPRRGGGTRHPRLEDRCGHHGFVSAH